MRGFPAQPARDALARLAADRQLSVTDCARTLGIDRSTIQRLYRRDRLRYDAADHIAVALGRHPYELWPTWFTAATPPAPPAAHRDTPPGRPRQQPDNGDPLSDHSTPPAPARLEAAA